ncbi:MAG: hypothetical protein KGJ86_00870 [Chloroflexota bacterium]|nr:hypothetical protein [Chloroflexota bacterium]
MKSRIPFRLDFQARFRGHPIRSVMFAFVGGLFLLLTFGAILAAGGISPAAVLWALLSFASFAPILVWPEGLPLEALLLRKLQAAQRPVHYVKYGPPPVVLPTPLAALSTPQTRPVVAAPAAVPTPFLVLRPLALGALSVLLLITFAASNEPFMLALGTAASNIRSLVEAF